MFLERIGAGEAVLSAYSPFWQQGLMLARVATAQREIYQLFTEDGVVEAEPSGAFHYRATGSAAFPVTGDWVAIRKVGPAQALVEATLPRSTCLSRRAAGTRNDEQPLAANVDVAFLVCGLDGDFNPRRMERYLALAAIGGVRAVVALNKADLCSDLQARIEETSAVARSAPVVALSALAEDGAAALRAFLPPNATAVLLGSSGAGKSTIANALLCEQRQRTAETRTQDSRGRHTTVRRELMPLPGGGALIDTPGLRELQLWASAESVDAAFDDIAGLAEGCRFRDCSHMGEPGCAVEAALAVGALDAGRVANFHKLRAEAHFHESQADPLTALERKRKWKAIRKQARAISRARH